MSSYQTKGRRPAPARMTPGESIMAAFSETAAEMRETLHDKRRGVNVKLLMVILLLLVVGVLMMYSASYAYSYEYNNGDSGYFFRHQSIYAAIGLVLMFFASLYPAEKYKSWTLPIFGLAFVLLVVVLFCPAINESHRWIPLGPFGTFQPSEVGKLALILFCATWATNHAKSMKTFKYGVLPFILAIMLIVGPVMLETHLSCAILMVLITGTLMFVGGMDWKWFAAAVGAGVAGVVLLLSGVFSYNSSRITAYKDPFSDPLGAGWQNIQALYAISSGGLFGQGIGQSHQKHLYISEPQNDFVFSVVCEELGFVGAVVIILLFCTLVVMGINISMNHPDRFCRLLGIGISAQVGWQTLLNVAVVTKTIPNTGIGLPFFSAGGTAIVLILFEMGILLSISRDSRTRRI